MKSKTYEEKHFEELLRYICNCARNWREREEKCEKLQKEDKNPTVDLKIDATYYRNELKRMREELYKVELSKEIEDLKKRLKELENRTIYYYHPYYYPSEHFYCPSFICGSSVTCP